MTPNLPAQAPATRCAQAQPLDAGAAGRAGGIRAYTLAWRRVAAWVIDWLILSAFAVALVPLGLLLLDRSVRLPSLGWNAASFVVLIVPATVWLAAWESGRLGATPGKRLLGLRVRVSREGDLGRRRAAARNAFKVALPWELGHTAAFLLANPKASGSTVLAGMASAVLACALGAGYVASLFIGTGRTPYDRAAATRVVRSQCSAVGLDGGA